MSPWMSTWLPPSMYCNCAVRLWAGVSPLQIAPPLTWLVWWDAPRIELSINLRSRSLDAYTDALYAHHRAIHSSYVSPDDMPYPSGEDVASVVEDVSDEDSDVEVLDAIVQLD